MIKEVKYAGYSVTPSGYECQDGELDLSLNLINEDDTLRPLCSPAVVIEDIPEGYKCELIHDVVTTRNIVFSHATDSGIVLYTSEYPEISDLVAIPVSLPDIRCIKPIGNTIVISTSQGMRYILWKDGAYRYIGERPPEPNIIFGCSRVGTLTKSSKFKIPDSIDKIIHPDEWIDDVWADQYKDATKADITTLTNAVLGPLLSEVADKVTQKGFFYQPFFVRYAYRMYDGSYAWHSAPVLMLPNVAVPFLECRDNGSTVRLNVPYFRLDYRITGLSVMTVGEKPLDQWKDIIEGIDIFVSEPIYTYDQSLDLEKPFVCLYDRLVAKYASGPDADYAASTQTKQSIFWGIWRGLDKDSGHLYQNHETWSMYANYNNQPNGVLLWNIKPRGDFFTQIKSVANFYKIAVIQADDAQYMPQDNLKELPLETSDFSALQTLPVLKDDHRSRFTMSASTMFVYNSRLCLGNLRLLPAEPLPIALHSGFSRSPAGTIGSDVIRTHVDITIWTRINSSVCSSEYKAVLNNPSDQLYDYHKRFPRWLWYPDANAFRMRLSYSDGSVFEVPLKRHDFLNGAYYLDEDNFFKMEYRPNTVVNKAKNADKSADIPAAIYLSEVNNPFIYPAEYTVSVGTGQVRALSTAAKALSQGQFGQFPLYAFTSDGIWALELSSEGKIMSRQPITRDVCDNIAGITQIDSAVLFPTARGIMLLSGSEAQCISDRVNTDFPFKSDSLPAMDIICRHVADAEIQQVPFLEFISECSMTYDYVHQRIIVYNPNYRYSYILSLKTQAWSTAQFHLAYNVNSYPDSLVVCANNSLVNFSVDKDSIPGLMITRPLKFGMPDILKTVDTAIQRGEFLRGNVQSVIYGSRDMINWHLIWSSKDHYLRGFRGTPYKYFRIACLTSLSEGESLCGASIQLTPRQTNQLR